MNLNKLEYEDTKSSRRLQGKRLLANNDTCKVELNKEMQLLFTTYEEALEKANIALAIFPPYSRSRTLEASIIQSCFAENLLKNFSDKAFFGKYRRLILRVKGYLILFKKLNNKGYPMNIKTINVQSILNQSQILDLFSESDYNDEPILYFGYQKNRIGEYINPQLIYIDENEVKFSISEADVNKQISIQSNLKDDNVIGVKPKLKESHILKKVN